MRREDIDPFLRSLTGPKYRPAIIVAGISAAVVTFIASLCLWCGIAGWLFPATPPRDAARTQETTLTDEDVRKLSEAYDRGRDQAMVADVLRTHKELPALDPSQFQFDEVGRIEHPMMVVQVIDEKNALVRVGTRRSTLLIWVTGASTASWVDDEPLHLEGAFIVAGKRQYLTVTGAGKTVYLLRWIEPATVEKARASLPST